MARKVYMQNQKLTIIAGPCSINQDNLAEILNIADIHVTNRSGITQRAIAGLRMVGLKSRSSLKGQGFS